MRRWTVTFGVFMMAASTGCFGEAAMKQVASGYIGCAPDDIEVSNDSAGFNERSFDATCHGHLYHCSGVYKGGASCMEDRAYHDPEAIVVKVPVTAPAANAAVQVAGGPWKRFTSKPCRVSALFPGVPKQEVTVVKGKSSAAATYVDEVESDRGGVYVACTTAPGMAPLRVGEAMDAARDRLMADLEASVDSEQDFDRGDAAGRDVRFTLDKDRGRARILVEGREVVVMTILPIAGYTCEQVRAFFDSLEPAPPDVTERAQATR